MPREGVFRARPRPALWRSLPGLVLLGILVSCASAPTREAPRQPVASGGVEWIDVHVHLVGGRGPWAEDSSGAARAAVAAMDEAGIRQAVVMPPPQVRGGPPPYDYESFIAALKPYPGRFAFLGGGGTLNPLIQEAGQRGGIAEEDVRRFGEKAEEILRQGGAGFGEISAHHLSLMSGHPYESVPADHPLLLRLTDIAARHGVVIDLHFDPVTEDVGLPGRLASPSNPPVLRANLAAFERLLAHNRKARIVWAHAGSDPLGQWTAALSRELLRRHPNLHMSLRMGGGVPQNLVLDAAGEIKPEWLSLFREFPDRFVIGGDQFFVTPQLRGPGLIFAGRAPLIRERTRRFLSRLPPDLAGQIGRENAIRLYRLTR
ncbi:MAG: amidohydrolase family protein [Deltaproteobacteria bacterium]|nr:amidohydrolase family protein [Deltaproteobacteria bacterium]